MAKPKAPPKSTFADLRAAGKIPPDDIDRMEELSIRCMQILEEIKILEAEYGYKDSGGVRHPGIVDELEGLFIAYDLAEPGTGLRIENYTAAYFTGNTPPRIDEHLLLAEAVPPETILKCRVSSPWAGLQFRRDPVKSGDGGEE